MMNEERDLRRGTVEFFLRDMGLPVQTHYGVRALLWNHFEYYMEKRDESYIHVVTKEGVEFEFTQENTHDGAVWKLFMTKEGHRKLMWQQEKQGRRLLPPQRFF